MNLIDDIDFVFPHLRGNPNLVNQVADVVNAVVRGSIELMNIELG